MPSQLHEALKLLFELDEHFLLDLLPGAGISVEGLVIEGTLPTSVSVPELASDACLRRNEWSATAAQHRAAHAMAGPLGSLLCKALEARSLFVGSAHNLEQELDFRRVALRGGVDGILA